MADTKPPSATLTVNLVTGDFLLVVPADFDYTGPGLDILDRMLPTIPVRRSGAA